MINKYIIFIVVIFIISLYGCDKKKEATVVEIIEKSISENKPALIFLYENNTYQNDDIQYLISNHNVRNYIDSSYLFYKINISIDQSFQELLYTNSKNYFVVIRGDSIVSIFNTYSNPNSFINQLKNYTKYSLTSQIDKYTYLLHENKLIVNNINKIFKAQYLKKIGKISNDKYTSIINETYLDMPYFYNRYLISTMQNVNNKKKIELEKNLTRMENIVYKQLIHKHRIKTSGISSKNKAKICYNYITYDFGKVKVNDTARCYFKYKNIGKTPYIIYNIETSCHCTTSRWNLAPIEHNEIDSICISYISNSPGRCLKRIRVQSNTEKDQYLTIQGSIIP